MTGEGGFLDRRRAIDGGGRFKDRTVLVGFGLLAVVSLVFCAGMAAAYFQSYAPKALFPVIIGGASAALLSLAFIASSHTASGREKAAS